MGPFRGRRQRAGPDATVTYRRRIPAPTRILLELSGPRGHDPRGWESGVRLLVRRGWLAYHGELTGPSGEQRADELRLPPPGAAAAGGPIAVDCLPDGPCELLVGSHHLGLQGWVLAEERAGGVTLRAGRGLGADWREDVVAELRFVPIPEAELAGLRDLVAGRDPGGGAGRAAEAEPEAAAGLPGFRYHPDPVGSGALARTGLGCEACHRARGWRYTGPLFTEDDELAEAQDAGDLAICPWCIADGRAARELGASFVDYRPPSGRRTAPAEAVDEIERRTPGFATWYHPVWLEHHGDACAYVATVRAGEAGRLPPEQQAALRRTGLDHLWEDPWGEGAPRPDGLPPAYLFRCLRCGEALAYPSGA